MSMRTDFLEESMFYFKCATFNIPGKAETLTLIFEFITSVFHPTTLYNFKLRRIEFRTEDKVNVFTNA
jgi:hypothetical protein